MKLSEFIYKGKLLPDYCAEVGQDFNYISKLYTKKRRYSSNDIYTTEELFDMIFSSVKNHSPKPQYKYYYDGMPLVEYCKLHPEYSYSIIVRNIEKKLKVNPERSIKDILDEYFSQKHIVKSKYIRSEMSLKEYCETHDINYMTILKQIDRLGKKCKDRRCTILKSLREYCEEYDLDYDILLDYLNRRRVTLGLKPYPVSEEKVIKDGKPKSNSKLLKFTK